MGGGVANGKKGSQLVQALAPVVAQQGLGPAALARVAGLVATRLERYHFVSSQGKGDKHGTKITPPHFMRLLLLDYLITDKKRRPTGRRFLSFG